MKYILTFLLIPILLTLTISCNSQNQKTLNNTNEPIENSKTVAYGERDIVTSSLLDKNGNLWFGTTREGVYKYDENTFTNLSESDGLSDNEVWSMIEDTEGNLWFGTGNGLCKYDGKTFTNIPIPWDGSNDIWGEMCNPNIVTSLIQDRKGDLWVGTCGGGAYRYDLSNEQEDDRTFTSFLAKADRIQSDSLHHNLIKSIVEDDDGNIWFTSLTHGAVNRYDGKEMTHFSTKDGLFDDMIFCNVKDKKGNLWFGAIQTIDGGLYRYDGKRFTNFNKKDGLCDNFIFSVFADSDENIWVGTGKGLCLFDGENFTPMFPEESHRMGDIRTFVADKDGNIWFGGRHGNLWRYDGRTLTDFTNKKRDE